MVWTIEFMDHPGLGGAQLGALEAVEGGAFLLAGFGDGPAGFLQLRQRRGEEVVIELGHLQAFFGDGGAGLGNGGDQPATLALGFGLLLVDSGDPADFDQLALIELVEAGHFAGEDAELAIDRGLLQVEALDLAVQLGDLLGQLRGAAVAGGAPGQQHLLFGGGQLGDLGVIGQRRQFFGKREIILAVDLGDKAGLAHHGFAPLGFDHASDRQRWRYRRARPTTGLR